MVNLCFLDVFIYFFRIVLLFLRLFLLIVYTYAGIVKINEDWLRAEPVRHWIGKK